MYPTGRFPRTVSMPCNSTHITGNLKQPNSLGTCSSRELLLNCHLGPTVFIPDDTMKQWKEGNGRPEVKWSKQQSLSLAVNFKFVDLIIWTQATYVASEPSCPSLISCTVKAYMINMCSCCKVIYHVLWHVLWYVCTISHVAWRINTYQSTAKFYQSEITTTKSTTYIASPDFHTLVVAVLAVFIISAIISRLGTSLSFILILFGVSLPLVSDSVLSMEALNYQCSPISFYLLDIADFFSVALPINHIVRPRVYSTDYIWLYILIQIRLLLRDGFSRSRKRTNFSDRCKGVSVCEHAVGK